MILYTILASFVKLYVSLLYKRKMVYQFCDLISHYLGKRRVWSFANIIYNYKDVQLSSRWIILLLGEHIKGQFQANKVTDFILKLIVLLCKGQKGCSTLAPKTVSSSQWLPQRCRQSRTNTGKAHSVYATVNQGGSRTQCRSHICQDTIKPLDLPIGSR